MNTEDDEPENEPVIPSPAQLRDPLQWNNYKGKVIAIVDGEVRASAETLAECYRAIKSLGISMDDAVFTSVPRYRFVG